MRLFYFLFSIHFLLLLTYSQLNIFGMKFFIDTANLEDIAQAQKEFLEKKHVGKFVLIPSHDE